MSISLKPRKKYQRTLLICTVLLLIIAGSTWLATKQPRTIVGCTPRDDGQIGLFDNYVSLTFKDFQPSGNQFSGPMSLEIYPRFEGNNLDQLRKAVQNLKKASLEIDQYEPDRKDYIFHGGSEAPIVLSTPPSSSHLIGKGSFTWNGTAKTRAFYYPFDRYSLRVNGWLLDATDVEHGASLDIRAFSMDFGGSNFVPYVRNLGVHSPQDRFEITLERPLIIRVIAIVVAALLVFWLVYLVAFAKPEEHIGQLVSLFVGVFSIRGALLSGAPVFPGMIDFAALGVYFAAVLIVWMKWLLPIKETNTIACWHCRSVIDASALVCPRCTRDVA